MDKNDKKKKPRRMAALHASAHVVICAVILLNELGPWPTHRVPLERKKNDATPDTDVVATTFKK